MKSTYLAAVSLWQSSQEGGCLGVCFVPQWPPQCLLNLPVQNFKTPGLPASAKRLQGICADLLNPFAHLESNTLLHCLAFLVAGFCFIGGGTLEWVKRFAVPVPVQMCSLSYHAILHTNLAVPHFIFFPSFTSTLAFPFSPLILWTSVLQFQFSLPNLIRQKVANTSPCLNSIFFCVIYLNTMAPFICLELHVHVCSTGV